MMNNRLYACYNIISAFKKKKKKLVQSNYVACWMKTLFKVLRRQLD